MTSVGHNGGPPMPDDNPYGRDGYVRIARAMRDHPIVGFGKTVKPAEPERGFCYSRGEAWQDLIMECRWAPGEVINKGRKMEIKPGQLLGAISWLAHRWNWTPKTVRWFLDQLQADHMIERNDPDHDGLLTNIHPRPDNSLNGAQNGKQKGKQNGNQTSVISVCNYEIYQLVLQAQRQANGQPEGQANGKPTASARQANGNTLIKEEGKNYIITTSQQDAAREDRPSVGPAPDAFPVTAWEADPQALTDILTRACGDALDDPVNCIGLATAGTPIAWLRQGCLLEADIVPTLKAISLKRSGARISSWEYFTKAVWDARDRRLKKGRPPPRMIPAGKTPDGLSVDDVRRRDAEDAEIIRQQWSSGMMRR